MSTDVIVVGPNDEEQEAAGNPGGTRRVKVAAPFQVVHEGIAYRPGETPEVPEQLAVQWLAAGWVTE